MTTARTGDIGGRSGRPNPWPRCLQEGCWHRVPPAAIHPTCQRAGDYPALIAAVATHGPPCCPGECPKCWRCLDRPRRGWCDRCQVCIDCCPGHGKDGEDETGGQ